MSDVSVVLGSDSDMDIFSGLSSVLKEFGVSYEMRILSAHRTPDMLREYILNAEKGGTKIFIALAGLAAALPGVIASHTTCPVIGVPLSKDSPLMGFDSLFSILQMPEGVPVATVTINGGKNAALLACEILALTDEELLKKLISYKKLLIDKVSQKDKRFSEKGE